MDNFKDKAAIIFDASYDLGPCYVAALLARGARVLALCSDASAFAGSGERLHVVEIAEPAPEAWIACARRHIEALGGVDIAIHNDKKSAHPNLATQDYSCQDWYDTFNRNIHSAFLFTAAVLPVMRNAEGGSLLFISTSSSYVSLLGEHVKVSAAYETANAAINRYAKRLAVELAPRRINVNTVCAGNVDKKNIQDIVRHVAEVEKVDPQVIVEELQERQKLKGFIPADHVVAQVCHLVSDHSAYITGLDLIISGGMEL